MNGDEWQRVVQRATASGTTSDNKWQWVTISATKGDTMSDNEWQQVTINGNEWQRMTAVVQRIKTAQYTSKNGWLSFFQW